MVTLDIPFLVNGLVSKMVNTIANFAPDVVKMYPDNTALLCASVLGQRAKAIIEYNMMPCNSQVMLIGAPSSGKTTLIMAVRELNSDITIRAGTPEYIEQEIVGSIDTHSFAEGVLCIDEFGEYLQNVNKKGYLSGTQYLFKRMYDCSFIEKGRVSTDSRMIPSFSYMISIYMGLTYWDYITNMEILDEAFIRRIMVLEFKNRIPKVPRRRTMEGFLTLREELKALGKYQINVIVDENLEGALSDSLSRIEQTSRMISDSACDACCDYFWKIMAWRAIDRAFTTNKIEETDQYFKLASPYLAKAEYTPALVYVTTEDIKAAEYIVITKLIENYKVFTMLMDPNFARIWFKIKEFLKSVGKPVEMRTLSRKVHLKYRDLEDTLKTCLVLGLVRIFDEDGEEVLSADEISRMHGKWVIALPEMPGMSKYKSPAEVLNELKTSINYIELDIVANDISLARAIMKLLEEEYVWLVEIKDKLCITAKLKYVKKALNQDKLVLTGKEAIDKIKTILKL